MRVLFFDIETHDASLRWDMHPQEFVRLSGYAWDDGPVHITDDPFDIMAAIRFADLVVGHNIHAFDLSVLYGVDSIRPLTMARQGRVFDTWTHSTLVNPCPRVYTNLAGKDVTVVSLEQAKKWHALDEQAHQLGVPGKVTSLHELAKKHGGFGSIPTDDSEYRDYLVGDVESSRAVYRKLLELAPVGRYEMREQVIAAIAAQITRNGWRVARDTAQERVDQLAEVRQRCLDGLVRDYGMPSEGKAPWRTDEGKIAILKALADVGINPDDLPRTPTGNPSLGGASIVKVAQGHGEKAEELARVISEIGGIRPLAEAALKHTHGDGRVHPEIGTLQRSGRWSTQNPGLTTWTSRGAGAVEKRYFVANGEGEKLVAFDLEQADARIVAACSGDRAFARRFDPGVDAHMLTAYAVWGNELVDTDPGHYRQIAKVCGHAYSYRASARTIQRATGTDLETAEKFVETMQKMYPGVTLWQERMTRAGRTGWVTNAWGRRMLVDPGREWTQAPALVGQSGTREIICDGLIRLPDPVLRMVVVQIHDEIILSIPETCEVWPGRVLDRDEIIRLVRACLETRWGPAGGQMMRFPVGVGQPADTWEGATH